MCNVTLQRSRIGRENRNAGQLMHTHIPPRTFLFHSFHSSFVASSLDIRNTRLQLKLFYSHLVGSFQGAMVLPTFSTLLPMLAVLLHIIITSIAQDTFCQIYFGASYADYCCTELHSHGPPCDTPISVANATDCTEEVYPRGWFCCIDAVRKTLRIVGSVWI